MTMTTTTEAPTPPAWLNLDVIVDDGLVHRVTATAAEVEALVPVASALMERARGLVDAVEEACKAVEAPADAEDGIGAALRYYSGLTRLHEAVLALDAAVEQSELT